MAKARAKREAAAMERSDEGKACGVVSKIKVETLAADEGAWCEDWEMLRAFEVLRTDSLMDALRASIRLSRASRTELFRTDSLRDALSESIFLSRASRAERSA